MADTMLQHYKVWVKLCVYTQAKQTQTIEYTPNTPVIPQKGSLSQAHQSQKIQVSITPTPQN